MIPHRVVVQMMSVFSLVWIGLAVSCQSVHAQGLIWSVPETGTWVRYTGEYRQTTVRPQSPEGDLTLEWQRMVEIRCLSRETASWKGEEVSCVWLEFESMTGEQVDGQLEAGPGSARIYKVLVPESEILGKAFFDLEIPRAYLPIVKGYRKIGAADPEPLQGNVFQTFPVFSQVLINEHAKIAGQESTEVITGSFETDRIDNTNVIEDSVSRTTNVTQVWISETAPFGTVKWTVRVDREIKTLVDARDLFKKHSDITVEMQAAQTGNDAVTKLMVP